MKTTTLYRPLKCGEIITKECVYFDFQDGERITAYDHTVGEAFSVEDHPVFFLPVEVADALLPAPPEAPKDSAQLPCPWCIPGVDNCHHTDAEIAAELTPAPEKAEEWAPLGPEDVTPNSVFNLVPGDIGWRTPFMVCESGVVLLRDTDETGVTMSAMKWDELHKDGATISRDFGKTWGPCRKKAATSSLSKRTPEEYTAHLEEIIAHAALHGAYKRSGYNQMTTEMKATFDEIAGRMIE